MYYGVGSEHVPAASHEVVQNSIAQESGLDGHVDDGLKSYTCAQRHFAKLQRWIYSFPEPQHCVNITMGAERRMGGGQMCRHGMQRCQVGGMVLIT